MDKEERFISLGEQLQAIIRSDTPQGSTDERLLSRTADLHPPGRRGRSGLSESSPSGGGWLVQEDFINQLIKPVWDEGLVPSRIMRLQTKKGSNSVRVPTIDESSRADGSRWGNVRMYWEMEAAEKTKSKPRFGQLGMRLNKLIGLCYVTDELIEDAELLGSYITAAFQAEMLFKLTDAIINGTGAGMPQGVLNAPCLVIQAREAVQLRTVVWENIYKMHRRLIPSSRPNAIWLVNGNVEDQLAHMYYAQPTSDVPVYLPANLLTPFPTLWGHPVFPMEQCPALGQQGDIILADLSQYVGIDNGSMEGVRSIHVRFVYDEMALRFVYRFDGQPWLGGPITPYDGGDTQSHFVTLEGRPAA